MHIKAIGLSVEIECIKLYVLPELDRTMILGDDWLEKNRADKFYPELLNNKRSKNTTR